MAVFLLLAWKWYGEGIGAVRLVNRQHGMGMEKESVQSDW